MRVFGGARGGGRGVQPIRLIRGDELRRASAISIFLMHCGPGQNDSTESERERERVTWKWTAARPSSSFFFFSNGRDWRLAGAGETREGESCFKGEFGGWDRWCECLSWLRIVLGLRWVFDCVSCMLSLALLLRVVCSVWFGSVTIAVTI